MQLHADAVDISLFYLHKLIIPVIVDKQISRQFWLKKDVLLYGKN